jgi:hypothetical protein
MALGSGWVGSQKEDVARFLIFSRRSDIDPLSEVLNCQALNTARAPFFLLLSQLIQFHIKNIESPMSRSRSEPYLHALPPWTILRAAAYRVEAAMARKYIDCREFPNEANCTLAISGAEQEVLDAAVMHAVSVHGHEDAPELREKLRGLLKDAPETGARSPEAGVPKASAMHS